MQCQSKYFTLLFVLLAKSVSTNCKCSRIIHVGYVQLNMNEHRLAARLLHVGDLLQFTFTIA